MTDVQMLKQYFNLDEQISLISDRIDRLKDLQVSITSQLGSDVVSGTRTKSKLEDITLNLIDLENELEAAIANESALQIKVRTIIAKLADEKQVEIMTGRYLGKKPWITIAVDCGMTKRTVYKIHNQAMKELERMDKDG